MEYRSLYRKWRPNSFADGFIGQDHVVRTLRNALLQEKVGHAYLFTGPRGTGKTTAAKVFSKAINCTGRTEGVADPCNTCPSCERINAGVSLDVLEIDGASNRGIDEIRDLREKVKFAPTEGRFKIYIIDEVHMLTTEAFNALLKTLEEPPGHVIFIFATTEVHKVPATILSRCQRFDFKRLSTEEIVGRLRMILSEEERVGEDDALGMIARRADGGMRDAISLLEQSLAHAEERVTVADVRAVLGLVEEERLLDLAEAILQKKAATALGILEELRMEGKDLYLLAREAAFYLRDLLLLALPDEAGALVGLDGELRDRAKALAQSFPVGRLRNATEVLAETAQTVRRGTEGILPIEMAIVRLCAEDETDWLAKIQGLEERLRRLEAGQSPLVAAPTLPRNDQGVHTIPQLTSEKTAVAHKGMGEGEKLSKPGYDNKQTTEESVSASGMPTEPNSTAELDVTERWEDVLQAVKAKKRTVEALLREGTPGAFNGKRWSIRFASQFRFHMENLNQSATRTLVEEAAAQVLGVPVTVEFVPLEETVGESQPKQAPPSPKEEPKDFLEQSMAILGGEAKAIEEE